MNTYDNFPLNFQALLKQRCLSQLDIATLSGIHKQSINRYATGKTVPGWGELTKLADALNCTLDSFRTGVYVAKEDAIPSISDPRVEEMKPIVKDLGSIVSKLTEIISR